MKLIETLATRQRFGIRPGLANITSLLAALGNPHFKLKNIIHVAGTNGKGAVTAFINAALLSACKSCARYTSPHLVRINERFFFNGAPLDDDFLDASASRIEPLIASNPSLSCVTYFEALTAVAFDVFSSLSPDYTVLETGLGGRLDATNVCRSSCTVITRIGLDHCEILGNTPEAIAAEKAGIIKPSIPVVLGRNSREVRDVIESVAREKGAPLYYAPDFVSDDELPQSLGLQGSFNRENALTAFAVCKILAAADRSLDLAKMARGFSEKVVWPGRYQKVGPCLIDGAHNPPAARALVDAIMADSSIRTPLTLVAGFCGDKDVDETLAILRSVSDRAFAVKTSNPRSLEPDILAEKMRNAGFEVLLHRPDLQRNNVLVCGSLFLAGEILVELGAYPWPAGRVDPNETASSQILISLAAKIFNVPTSSLSLDYAYGSKGWDSVNHLRLAMEAERALGVFYPIERIPKMRALRDFLD